MSELRLDFQNPGPFPWVGVVLLVMALASLSLTAFYFFRLSDRVHALEAQLSISQGQDTARASKVRSMTSSPADLAQEVKNANDALRHLSVPWDDLFRAVESSGSNKVTLLSLEPDVEKRQVHIKGEAKNFKSIMSYITQMEGHDVFGSVFLQNHHVQEEDPDQPVQFAIIATWQDKQK